MNPYVCLFTDSLDPSGVGVHMATLAEELIKRYRVAVVCPPTPSGNDLLRQSSNIGATVFSFDVGDASALTRLGEWLAKEQFDLFHAHAGIGWEAHNGVAVAFDARVPAIVRTEHLPYLLSDPLQQEEYRQRLKCVDRVICVSDQMRISYVAAGVPESRIRVVRNGIRWDPNRVDPNDVRRRLDLPVDCPMVLTVGRLTAQKGYHVFAKAIPSILQAIPSAHFVWAGDGVMKEVIAEQLHQLGVQARVLLLGRYDDVPSLLAAADLFVLPSLFEGLPIVVLEAMAAGVPVIGTQVSGTTETIVDGVSGRLVPAEDEVALANAVIYALSRPAVRRAWAAEARAQVDAEFSSSRMASSTAAVYEELLRQRSDTNPVDPVLAVTTGGRYQARRP